MAVRSDFTIDWEVSPRIITIDAPATEVTIQDLYDTCRTLEAETSAMDDPSLIEAAGKEELGGGTSVGLTATLQNALVAFEARLSPQYIQCNVSGGNLVAVDDVGSYFTTPIHPTAFTQVVVTASSSATSANNAAIEYGSFNGGITYNASSPYSGTDYPVGTPQQPVNSIADAKSIAEERGFTTGFIQGDLTFDAITPVTAFTFVGSSKSNTLVTIPDAALVEDCSFYEGEITGVLDGESALYDCLVSDLAYINGYIEGCVLSGIGRVTLGGGGISHFLSCYSGQPGVGTPTMDMGGSGQALAMRDYNGGVLITNKTGPEAVSIDLGAGQVKIDLDGNFGAAGVTNGTIVVRGDGKVIDATTGDYLPSGTYGGLTLLNETVGTNSFSESKYNNRVYFDSTSEYAGQSYPIGTLEQPVNNLTDALILMNKYSCKELYLLSDISFTIGVDISSKIIVANKSLSTTVTLASGVIFEGTEFSFVKATGVSGCGTYYSNCLIENLSEMCGTFEDCMFNGNNACSDDPAEHIIMNRCRALSRTGTELACYDAKVTVQDWISHLIVTEKTGTEQVNIQSKMAKITVQPSCVAGEVHLSGTAYYTDNTGAGCSVVTSKLNNRDMQSDAVLGGDIVPYHDTDTVAGSLSHMKHLNYRVYVDADNPEIGDGSQHNPFSVQGDALDYAEAHNLKRLMVYSDMDITRNLKQFVVDGIGTPILDFQNGVDLRRSEFTHCELTGSYTDSIIVRRCYLNSVYLNGEFETCSLNGEFIIPDGGVAYLTKCTPFEVGFTKPVYDIGGVDGTAVLMFMGYKGGGMIRNCNQVTDVVKMILRGGIIEIEDTCTIDGTIIVIGEGRVINHSTCDVNTNDLVNKENITKEVVTYNGEYHA